METWKVGGSTNFMIAAARLGLTLWSCGHVADDDVGKYILQVLQVCLSHPLRVCASEDRSDCHLKYAFIRIACPDVCF